MGPGTKSTYKSNTIWARSIMIFSLVVLALGLHSLLTHSSFDALPTATSTGYSYTSWIRSKVTKPKDSASVEKVTVAFVGDQGYGIHANRVLQMIKAAGVQGLVLLGDLDYMDKPALFYSQFSNVLGDTFPLFVPIGNHDVLAWEGEVGYLSVLLAHQRRSGLAPHCFGNLGVTYACLWKGLLIVTLGIGTLGSDHVEFLDSAMRNYSHIPWKVCAFHKNQKAYQTGDKVDETGYEVYDSCRRHGAIIATGHEHSYARTHLMSSFENKTIASTNNTLSVQPGRSFAFVSGLGGFSIRPWVDGAQFNPWWAANAALDNGVSFGALICEFTVDRRLPAVAECSFVDIFGMVWDQFKIKSSLVPAHETNEPELIGPIQSAPTEPNSTSFFWKIPPSVRTDGFRECSLEVHPVHARNRFSRSSCQVDGRWRIFNATRRMSWEEKIKTFFESSHTKPQTSTQNTFPRRESWEEKFRRIFIANPKSLPNSTPWKELQCEAADMTEPCRARFVLPREKSQELTIHVQFNKQLPRTPLIVCKP